MLPLVANEEFVQMPWVVGADGNNYALVIYIAETTPEGHYVGEYACISGDRLKILKGDLTAYKGVVEDVLRKKQRELKRRCRVLNGKPAGELVAVT